MINTVTLMGRLTKDPEIRVTNSNKKVLQFGLAVDRDKETTYFINCVAWEKIAETIAQYCGKGDQLGVSGILTTRQFDNAQGQKVYVTEVLVQNFSFGAKKSEKEDKTEAPALTINDNDLPF